MLFLFRYLRGFLRIRVTGFSPQRFLNLCSSHGILLWDINPGDSAYEMTVSLSDFYRLKPLLKKTGTFVHILSRMGFPFVLAGWRTRKIFLIGFPCCFFMLVYLSTFIWAIDVEGNEQLTREMLLAFLQQNKVTYGVKKSEIDIRSLEKAIRNEYGFITWTSARVDGTKLTVSVKENDVRTGEALGTEEPADLVCDENGFISSIITRRGIPCVKEGQEVKAGDILISGDVAIIGDGELVLDHKLVRADGDVFVCSRRVYTDYLEPQYEVKEYTGRIRNTYSVTAFGRTARLFHPPDTGTYTCATERCQLRLFEDFYLPLFYEKNSYSEYVPKQRYYTAREAEAILKEDLKRYCRKLEEKGVQIPVKDVRMSKEKKRYVLQGCLTIVKRADRMQRIRTLYDDPAKE